MSNPLEDEVIKYIASKRPLKLVFLTLAVIGVLGSAYKTIEPMIAGAKPIAFRVLNISLDPETSERLGCAYFSGTAQSDLPRSNQTASSQGPETILQNVRRYQNRLSQCMALLGSVPQANWTPTSATSEELRRAQQTTITALYTLSGVVQSKDRLSYLLFRLGADIAYVEANMAPQAPEERQMLMQAPDRIELYLGRRLSLTLEEAKGACPCKFPDLRVNTATRGALLEATRAIDKEMIDFLKLPPL